MAKSVDEINSYENAFLEDMFSIAVMHEAKELFGEKGFVFKVQNSFNFRCKSFENRKVYIKEKIERNF